MLLASLSNCWGENRDCLIVRLIPLSIWINTPLDELCASLFLKQIIAYFKPSRNIDNDLIVFNLKNFTVIYMDFLII